MMVGCGQGDDETGGGRAIPITAVEASALRARLEAGSAFIRRYAAACGFKAEPGSLLLVPDMEGALAEVLFGVAAPDKRDRDPFAPGRLADLLPPGRYRLADGFAEPALAALAIELAAYRFERCRTKAADRGNTTVEAPPGVDLERLRLVADAVAMGRDLINRPANDLTPSALEAAVESVAARHGAAFSVCRGGDLLARDLPMIHAVGRAAAEPPRLAEFVWGVADAPKVTLVGKGVCFDTGGLDIKPSAGMLMMKKDMGGAAAVLALAAMVMGAGLPVRLRVLVPIVENSISADAFRPGDVLASRKGLTVEVGNTDAEGRLILADALALADEEAPALLLDFATLTGAARVALGPDLPPVFTDDDGLADAILRHGQAVADPGWRMPLWGGYDPLLKSKVADLGNVSGGPFAGSITAALFLRRFVEKAGAWAHFDIYGWTPSSRPGRPEGGEVQMARAVFAMLEERFHPAEVGS